MLRTNSHEASHIIEVVLEHIVAVDGGKTVRRTQHSRQHRDRCCLACAVVTEQGKYLTFVHAHIHSIDSAKPISKRLPQILYLEILVHFL